MNISKLAIDAIAVLGSIMVIVVIICSADCNKVSYQLNATGQVLCYDENGNVIEPPTIGDLLFGQDANYLTGAEMSFKDNGDGTVSDLNTALMWQQTPPVEGMTWAQAQEYCENLELGGYSDWRLPTLKELFSISDFSAGWPYIDTAFFDLSSEHVSKDEQYWADNRYVGETVEGRDDAAFGVNHVTGHIKAYPSGSNMTSRGGSRPEGAPNSQGGERGERPQGEERGERPQGGPNAQGGERPQGGERGERPQGGPNAQGGERPQGEERGERTQGGSNAQQGSRQMGNNPMAKQVRAVRGNLYGENKFVDNGDGTISDVATGLMWSKDDNGEGIEWIDALPYAEGATLAGYSDWRLPNVKELQSIVDYSRAPSSKGVEAAIDPIFNSTPFVNEAGDDDYGYYWTGTSACFTKGRPFYFAWYVAFGRAVNSEGKDFHGAGAVRFDSKSNNDITVEGGEERYFNFVRLVRSIK
ncbi:MAG: DUF1566 domain-containing protein [Rikenellaceae bacterium]